MSAYASSLFLPPTTSSSPKKDEKVLPNGNVKKDEIHSVRSIETKGKFQGDHKDNLGEGNEGTSSSPISPQSTMMDEITSSMMVRHCSSMNLYDITVKSAFIDPITFLTSTNNKNANAANADVTGAARTEAPTWSEAMQFTLTVGIISNGRKYCAKRDLASLFKFRDDLIVEQQQQQQLKIKSQTRTNEIHEEETKEKDHIIEIPHVPIESLTNQMNCGQSLTQSFSGLQSAIKSYYPQTIETWLRSVATMMPFSQTLQQFLYEPGKDISTSFFRKRPLSSMCGRRSNRIHSTLYSITESKNVYDETENEDDCDDF